MVVRLFRVGLLPPGCRKGQAAFRRACRLALGRRAADRGEINVIFTTNPEIRRINRRFLGHDLPTDVIAFPYPSSQTAASPFGDIYISVDQARKQARKLGHPLLEELLILTAHGALHLCGYNDHAPRARARMFARQDRVVKALLPTPGA